MTVTVPTHPRVFVALHGGCVVFCSILFLVLWDCIDLKHKKNASSRIKYYSIIAITMYAISSTVMLLYFILLPTYHFEGKYIDHLFQIGMGIFWRIGQSFLYLLFLQRLRHSFKNTKYALSNKMIILIKTGVAIFIISYIIKTSIYIYLYNHNHDEDTDSLYAIVGDIDMGITQIIDLLLSIGIMTLFLNKLYKLNVDLSDIKDVIIYHHQSQNNKHNKSFSVNRSISSQGTTISRESLIKQKEKLRKLSLNQRQKSVIGIMAKITLLSGIALASSQIVLFLGGALYLSELIPKYNYLSHTFWSLKMAYFAINAVIISSSIALSFDFSYKWYKNCCNRIDKICVKCCTWSTKKKITKISSSSIDNLLANNSILTSNPSSNIESNLSSPKYDSGYDIGGYDE